MCPAFDRGEGAVRRPVIDDDRLPNRVGLASKESKVASRVSSALWAGMITETPDVRAGSEGEATSAQKMASLSVFRMLFAAFKAGKTNGICPKFIPALRTDQGSLRIIDHSAVSCLTKVSASGEGPCGPAAELVSSPATKTLDNRLRLFPHGSSGAASGEAHPIFPRQLTERSRRSAQTFTVSS